MAVKKFVTGNFYDEAVLFPAVKKTRLDLFMPLQVQQLLWVSSPGR